MQVLNRDTMLIDLIVTLLEPHVLKKEVEMLLKRTMMLTLLLAAALFFAGCGEDPAPVAAGPEETIVEEPVIGDADDVLGEASEDFIAVMDQMPEAAPGQWITFESDRAQGAFTLSILRSEDFQGVPCLWYQFSMEETVFQVLIDQAMFDTLKEEMQVFIREMGSDPAAWFQTNLSGGDPTALFMPEDDPARMMNLFRAIKMLRIGADGQIIAIDMNGVPELLESMMAQDPDMFSRAGMEPDSGFQQFASRVQEAEFRLDYADMPVAHTTLGCLTLAITDPDQGTISLAFSSGLPILPLVEVSVVPLDPMEEGGRVFVSGFGFDGATDLMPGPATQTIPAAMMLQGLLQQAPRR